MVNIKLYSICVVLLHIAGGNSIEYHEATLQREADTSKRNNDTKVTTSVPLISNVSVNKHQISLPHNIHLEPNIPTSRQAGVSINSPLGGLLLPTGMNLQLDPGIMPTIKEHLTTVPRELSHNKYPVELYIVNPSKVLKNPQKLTVETTTIPSVSNNRDIVDETKYLKPSGDENARKLHSDAKKSKGTKSNLSHKHLNPKTPGIKLKTKTLPSNNTKVSTTEDLNRKNNKTAIEQTRNIYKINEKDVSHKTNENYDLIKDLKQPKFEWREHVPAQNNSSEANVNDKYTVQVIGILEPAEETSRHNESKKDKIVNSTAEVDDNDNLSQVTAKENSFDADPYTQEMLDECSNSQECEYATDRDSSQYAGTINRTTLWTEQTMESRTGHHIKPDITDYINPTSNLQRDEDRIGVQNHKHVRKHVDYETDANENSLSFVYNENTKPNEVSTISRNFKICTKGAPSYVKVNLNYENLVQPWQIARYYNQQWPLIYRNGYYWSQNTPVISPSYYHYNQYTCSNQNKYRIY